MPVYRSSRYNFVFPVRGGSLLYNANTGALVRLGGKDRGRITKLLMRPGASVLETRISRPMKTTLTEGGFIVAEGVDELLQIRERYLKARTDTPMVITITTTMDCNLGCYYCYEERSEARLENANLGDLLSYTRRRLEVSGKKSLHVDWYGGEPLLNVEFLETASAALQELCQTQGVKYVASVISNGTEWPEDVGAFVARHRIHQVQISFDGLKKNHDKRRRYRSKAIRASGASSFDRAIALVDRLLDCTRVDVRFNIDHKNKGDLLPFYEFAQGRGWFEKPFSAVIQPARLAVYSAASSFLRSSELSVAEFDELRARLRARFGSVALIEESEVPDKYPYPKTGVCAALASDSAVVGADAKIYRCGLQASETHRSVAALAGPSLKGIPIRMHGAPDRQAEERAWWEAFDPTRLPTCSRCSFLPICWGGCPKKHLEGDQHAIAEQSEYWRRNLARLVTAGAEIVGNARIRIPRAQQFR